MVKEFMRLTTPKDLDTIVKEFGRDATDAYVEKIKYDQQRGVIYDNPLETMWAWMMKDRARGFGYWRDVQLGLRVLIEEFGQAPVHYYSCRIDEKKNRGHQYVDSISTMYHWMVQDKERQRGYWSKPLQTKSVSNKIKRHGGS